MTRFNSKARMIDELTEAKATVQAANRVKLNSTELQNLYTKAVEGLSTKLSSLPMDDNQEQLVHQYNLTLRVDDFQKYLHRYDMYEVFNLYVPEQDDPSKLQQVEYPEDDTKTIPKRVNLFTNGSEINEEQVKASNRFLNTYGQSYDLQNL